MTSQRKPRTKIRILSASVPIIAVLAVLVALVAPAIAQSPVPFIDQPLVPDATAPGGPAFTLTVNGAGFVAASVVNWNGSPRATTFVNSSQLTATILASDISRASTAAVTVVNPSPGGGVSNTQFFSITVAEAYVSFLPTVTYGSGGQLTYSAAVADLNGDGKLDLVVANGNDGAGSAGVLLGNGDGTFQSPVGYSSGGLQAASIVVADVNGDGIPDLVVANSYYSNTVGVLLGNGDGTFRPVVTYNSGGGGPWSVVVADVNGDGKPDILVANQSSCYTCTDEGLVGVLLGNGDGTFQPAVMYSSGGYSLYSPTALAVADLNGDGKLDLAVTNVCGADDKCSGNASVGVLLGNGDGTFQAAVNYGSGGKAPSLGSLAIADVNGDGKPDLLVANGNCLYTATCEPGAVGVLLGNGDGTFRPAVSYGSGAYGANSLAVADVNGDGKPDLVVANLCYSTGSRCPYSETGVVGVLLGNGDGTFQSALTYNSGGIGATGVAVADVNNDGRPDLLVANLTSYPTGEGAVGALLGSSAPLCVGKCATSTALVSNLNPSVYRQAITFTARVTSNGGAPTNGEPVTFFNGLNVLGTAPLVGGIASLTKSSLQAGIHTILAAYLGDANFTSSTSPVLQQVVDTSGQAATTTALTSRLNPSIYGQRVTWTAAVTTTGSIAPTGKVSFKWGDGNSVGSATLNASGVATLTLSDLNADPYPLIALYNGDANNGPSVSAILNQVITQTTSAATLTSSANPSTVGQNVTFTAEITSPTVKATGPVTFTAGKTVLGTVELANSKATLTMSSLAAGSNVIIATYNGDSDILGSSASVTQVVGLSSSNTTTALTYSVNNSTLSETFAAKVTSSSGTPTGNLTFTVGKTVLGRRALSNGQATLTVSTLTVGSSTVTATYNGNSAYTGSLAWVTQTFVMPVNGTLYLQQEGGSAAATTTFGLGTTPSNFVPAYTGLPNNPNPTGQVLVGSFTAGTLVNFGMYTTFGSESGWAFSSGTDQASLVAFADLSNSLGMNHGITQQTSSTTWLLHLDDALSYLYDDDNNDVLMELIVVPQ